MLRRLGRVVQLELSKPLELALFERIDSAACRGPDHDQLVRERKGPYQPNANHGPGKRSKVFSGE
jgi:hypothetical protein